MNTNPYAPPQAPTEADPVEELCVRAPDLREEIQAVAATGNQGPFAAPKPLRKFRSLLVWIILTVLMVTLWHYLSR